MPFLDIPMPFCYFVKDFREKCSNTYASEHSSTLFRYAPAEYPRREHERYS